MSGEANIELWRARAEEARAQAAQMRDGSVSQELLLSIAASYLRLINRNDWLAANFNPRNRRHGVSRLRR